MAEHGLGRFYAPDDRDEAYPLRVLLDPHKALPLSKVWKRGTVVDQGQTSKCVGYSAKGWLLCSPVRGRLETKPSADELYDLAQAKDGWPLPHEGSSVRAGLQALQDLGRVASYHWATSLDDVVRYVLGESPLWIGINWYQGQFTPDKEDIIRISGSLAGGHAILLNGMNREKGLATLTNSWGRSWAKNGVCQMPLEDLDRLLFKEDGEAAAALEAP